MFYYRLYSADSEDGHFIDVMHFLSESDAAAILEVGPDVQRVSRELWNRDRKVKDFPPSAPLAIEAGESNRLAKLIAGGRWRWDPLGGHCQAVAASEDRQSPHERASDNDRHCGPAPPPKPRLVQNFNAGGTPCSRHFI